METIVIQNAKYVGDGVMHQITIQATIDGITMSVPLDPTNRHYEEIMRQVDAGELVIEEAAE